MHSEYVDKVNIKKNFDHHEKIYNGPHIEPKMKYKYIHKEDARDTYIEKKNEHDEEKPRQKKRKYYNNTGRHTT